MEVTCRDRSYLWLLDWLSLNRGSKSQHLTVNTSFSERESGRIETQYEFHPSIGTHFFRHKSTWIWVERTREQRLAEPWETIQLTALGTQRELFRGILEEARAQVLSRQQGQTPIYTLVGTDWRLFGHPRPRRPLQSVVLDNGISSRIAHDVKEFIDSSQWYRERGIPYRRGYLLYGPPGCGKSSFILALAGELGLSIAIVNLSDRGLTDDRLLHRLADAPENALILLEDVDAAFPSPRNDDKENQHLEAAYQGLSRLTFSGLLNAIDGVSSSEGRILFMTTNHRDRLDPALIRPGRVDLMQYIGHCSRSQLINMFVRFYPDAKSDQAEKFADLLSDVSLSPAMVQGHFMLHKNNANEAVEQASKVLCDDRLVMSKEERNFRSAYYERVGFLGLDARRTTDAILNQDNPVSIDKCVNLAIKCVLPADDRFTLWKFMLGLVGLHGCNRESTWYWHQKPFEDGLLSLQRMGRIENEWPKAKKMTVVYLLVNRTLKFEHSKQLKEDRSESFMAICESVIRMIEAEKCRACDDASAFWISKELTDLVYRQSKFVWDDLIVKFRLKLASDQRLRKLHQHLEKIDFFSAVPLHQWFCRLFAGVLHESALQRIWDKVVAGSLCILVQVAIVLVQTSQVAILGCETAKEAVRCVQSTSEETDVMIAQKAIDLWQASGSPMLPQPQSLKSGNSGDKRTTHHSHVVNSENNEPFVNLADLLDD